MSLKYALYPGCAAKGATPELYQSTMAIIGRLGIEVTELTASSCCGAGVVAEADPDGALALNARTFAQAEQLGLDIMTICGTCQGVMSTANRQLKADPALLQRVNRLLEPEGLAYQGRVQVKHLLWIVVREVGLHKLKDEVQVTLGDLKIAPFYGCYILGRLGISASTIPKIPPRWRRSSERWERSRWTMEGRSSAAGSRSFWRRRTSRWR